MSDDSTAPLPSGAGRPLIPRPRVLARYLLGRYRARAIADAADRDRAQRDRTLHQSQGLEPDAGATWTQIHPSLAPNTITTRPAFAVTTLPNGNTRMYLYEGNVGTPYSRLFRSDSVRTARRRSRT
jgi:hypothetical protein